MRHVYIVQPFLSPESPKEKEFRTVKTMNPNWYTLTCAILRRSTGTGRQGACAEVQPSRKNPPKYPNMVMGIPKVDGRKLKTMNSTDSGMYLTTLVPEGRE